MGLFNRKKDEQPRTCPQCCQIVARDATTCDLCGADLTAEPATAGATTTRETTPLGAGVERYR